MTIVTEFDLDAMHVANAIGVTVNEAEGFFGPGVIGHATITVDLDARLEDWADYIAGEACAVFTPRISRNYDEIRLTGPEFPQALEDAYDHLDERYGIEGDDDLGTRIFARYARLHGYTTRERSLQGYCQSDWADVIAVEPADESEIAGLAPLDDLFRGDVFVVRVELEAPDGSTHEWSCGGLVGMDYAETAAIEEAICEVHAEVRHSRNAA